MICGVGANVAFSMGKMGLRPILVGAVGKDFAEYRSWLERHNVDCESIHYSEYKHTARFVNHQLRKKVKRDLIYLQLKSQ